MQGNCVPALFTIAGRLGALQPEGSPYPNRFRIRQPSDAGFDLKAHLDRGNAERWEDLEHSLRYEKDLDGEMVGERCV